MKKIALGFLMAGSILMASQYVNGYYRANGTYVQGYTKSSPDSHRYNNYGSQTMGGSQRDENSLNGATNKRNSSYGLYDNDNDGIGNMYDSTPNGGN